MKGIKLFFCVCLGTLAFGHAFAIDGDDTARAAARRPAAPTNVATTTRATPTQTFQGQNATPRTATTTPRTVATESRGATQTANVTQRGVSARTATVSHSNVQNRPATNTSRRATTNARATTSRAITTPRTIGRTKATTARAATNENGALVTNYTKCRTVFYECMDEFCATKDANLRRCACSARANEFDDIKRQMDNVENKMLDFNQRLLLVNMDAEDVNAINTATIGEDTFYSTKDTSTSKRALDDIAKKLNAKFGDTDSGAGGLGAISLTLNMDAAFDTVDSFMGIDTTTKSGVALYNAALPICHDIATEICTDEEISLAQSGYQMQIEQDCNTVKKAYQAQADQARTKVFESGALLDMSRLDAYQTRNSDDILTCKRKMLEMLTDTTVCGAKMEKCLDMTGRYIDPTTGAAFLSVNLADLDTMITRPGVNQTWTSANSSSKFIAFLNDRKKFLHTATENCQDIADTVWDAFIEDALAQIKLAQTAKLEEIRQACTKLTTECLNSASDSIENFDARALSIFGIMANKVATTMCADVQTSCSNLLSATGDESWGVGVQEISANVTYESIIENCTQVGRNCIIQACKSISGNFELCNDINFSANRHSILERTACWDDVRDCVASAGDDAIISIMNMFNKPTNGVHKYAFYDEMYGDANIQQIEDICSNQCSTDLTADCGTCRITERIWGNCEDNPAVMISTGPDTGYNHIIMPTDVQGTLLAWFGINTETAYLNGTSHPQSCVNTRCTESTHYIDNMGRTICLAASVAENLVTTEGMYCPTEQNGNIQMNITDTVTNCCFGTPNRFGNIPMNDGGPCCETGNFDSNNNICMPANEQNHKTLGTRTTDDHTIRLVCIGNNQVNGGGAPAPGAGFPGGQRVMCNGTFVQIIDDRKYELPSITTTSFTTNGPLYTPQMVYYEGPNNPHTNPTPVDIDHPASNWFIRY